MSDSLIRFLGDTPGRVALRLVFMSFIVGVIMAALGLNPADIVDSLVNLVTGIWNLGFDAVRKAGNYFLLGAAVVVPVWLVTRLLKSTASKP